MRAHLKELLQIRRIVRSIPGVYTCVYGVTMRDVLVLYVMLYNAQGLGVTRYDAQVLTATQCDVHNQNVQLCDAKDSG